MATFLLLMLVVVLIFAMLIANLGQVSLQATTVANAADSAALLLGSQLATTSNQIYTALGNRIQKCKKGGLFALILAIIVVVILTIINIYCGGCMTWAYPYVQAKIAARDAAGAIGGAVAGTGAAQGAIQGAIVGAAIGGGAAIGFQAGLYLGAAIGAPVGASTGALALTLGSIGAGVFTALAAGSSLYNAAVQEQDIQAAIASASKLLNRLSDRRRILEAVILSALTQTVDDPEQVADDGDLDGDGTPDDPALVDLDKDGQTTDRVSRFLVLWVSRLLGFDSTAIPEMEQAIVTFVEGPLARFRAAVERAYRVHEAGVIRGALAEALEEQAVTWFEGQGLTPAGGWSQWLPSGTPSFLGRSEIENRVQGANGQPEDVTMEELVVPLETSPRADSENDTFYEVPFWQPGPTLEQYANWGASDEKDEFDLDGDGNTEEDTPNPQGWDQADGAIEELVTFVESYDPLQAIVRDRAANPAALSELAMGWSSWVPDLYDPELDQTPPSFSCAQRQGCVSWSSAADPRVTCDGGASTDYERLYLMREMLGCWRTQLTGIRGCLPVCTQGGEGGGEGQVVQEQCVSDQLISDMEANECSLISCGPKDCVISGRTRRECLLKSEIDAGFADSDGCPINTPSCDWGGLCAIDDPGGQAECTVTCPTSVGYGECSFLCPSGGGGGGTGAGNFPCTWTGTASCEPGGWCAPGDPGNPAEKTLTAGTLKNMVKALEGIEPDRDDGFDAETTATAIRLCQVACNGEFVRFTHNGWDSPEDNEMWRWTGTAWEFDNNIGERNDQHIKTLTCTRPEPDPGPEPGFGERHATVDADQCDPDEFERVIGDGQDDGQRDGQLKALIDEIDAFRAASKALYDELNRIEQKLLDQGIDLPGAGFIQSGDTLTYWWFDTRGRHEVTVEVGPFRLPRTKKKKSGNFLFNKTCIKLVDGEDKDGSRTWVKITRKDPTNAPTRGWLWPWNPSDGEITKCASARFNWESVGLARTRRCDPADRPPPPDACNLE